jgi:integrase/recombinase XerD
MSFTSFLREKQYLENVSTNTLRWYHHALKWLPCENPDESQLKEMVVRMREQGLKPTGCNAAIRAINCYLRWAGSPHKVRKLKEPEQIMQTFSVEQVSSLVSFKPRTDFERRLHLLILILLDTGARISEVLGLQIEDIDLDNMLLTLHGKGRKDRKVPFSHQLRKALFKYIESRRGLLFLTANATPWTRIGALRAVKLHCERLGFKPPARTLHAFRHTAATHFIETGGSPLHLMRLLGHTTLTMTNRYVNLSVGNLQAASQQHSLLA